MPKNVLITPATGLIDFKDASGNIDAFIQLDDSGNLNISNSGGNLSLGNTATDVYIGDGVNSVDIIFEQNGDIRALAGKTLTLGQADSFITIASPTAFSSTITAGGVAVPTISSTNTLTNKTINLANNTLTGTLAQFNAALAGTDFASLDGTETLTNKTINLSNNTVSGTVAQFNTALSDGDFATLAGTETLTNKTLNGFTITGPVIAGGNAGANGYILVSAGGAAAPQWQANAAGTLDGLTDVQITSPTAQQILKFNGTIWQNADPDAAVASAVFATNAESDLGLVTDLVIGISEDLGFVYDVPATFIYNMGSLVVDGIVSLNNIDQSIKADYIGYAIIFGF